MNNEIEVTNKEIKMNFRGYDITIPKGTLITHNTACGYDENYNFINNLSWIPKEQSFIKHDATYYGINVNKEDVFPQSQVK